MSESWGEVLCCSGCLLPGAAQIQVGGVSLTAALVPHPCPQNILNTGGEAGDGGQLFKEASGLAAGTFSVVEACRHKNFFPDPHVDFPPILQTRASGLSLGNMGGKNRAVTLSSLEN